VQRGNAKLSWFWHGDALTPGVAATSDAPPASTRRRPRRFHGFPRFLYPRTRLRRSWSPCLEECRCASTSPWRLANHASADWPARCSPIA
jgi:hypothetical protein